MFSLSMQMLDFKISILFFLNLDFSSRFTSFILSLSKQVVGSHSRCQSPSIGAGLHYRFTHMRRLALATFLCAEIVSMQIFGLHSPTDVCFSFFFVYVSQTLSATEQKHFFDLLCTLTISRGKFHCFYKTQN